MQNVIINFCPIHRRVLKFIFIVDHVTQHDKLDKSCDSITDEKYIIIKHISPPGLYTLLYMYTNYILIYTTIKKIHKIA